MKMKFVEFREAIRNHFDQMLQDCGIDRLFVTGVDLEQLYDQYNDFFPKERNLLFRKQREHECSACRHFIKMAGGVVAIKPDYTIESIWDIKVPDEAYQEVADKMSTVVKRFAIADAFVPYSKIVGCKCNFETEAGTSNIRQWDHFYLEVPMSMVSREPNTDKAKFRGKAEVFERSLSMISMNAIDTVLDLIKQNNLYRGAEKKRLIEKFKVLKEKYDALTDAEIKSHFIWRESAIAPDSVSHIKNDVVGTLLVDISNGMELDEAVRLYESKTAPENYQRSKPVYSQRMLDDAKKKIEELGYMSALQRRFATIDDLTINEMLFVNRNAVSSTATTPGPEGLFESMEKSLAVDPRKYRSAPVLPINQFLQEVLPTATSIELLLESKLTKNMVSLIAPIDPDAKSMFKWPSPFSWAYTGNMTDSALKQNVKNAGGDVTGDLRFSIQWNDTADYDRNDLDAHCLFDNGHSHIYFGDKHHRASGGMLDIDIQHPAENIPAVENITFPDRKRMTAGLYQFIVHCYAGRGGRSGFRAEIEFDGQTYAFDYTNELRHNEQVKVADVVLDSSGNFTIKPVLNSTMCGGREVWGVMTNQFIPVVAVMDSPNYWQPNGTIGVTAIQQGIFGEIPNDPKGAHHLFFMLKDCKNPEEPNPFFNEFLNSDFNDFRRVMEALGSKAHVATVDDQLSGVGFAYTQHATVILKINGDKIYNVKF